MSGDEGAPGVRSDQLEELAIDRHEPLLLREQRVDRLRPAQADDRRINGERRKFILGVERRDSSRA